MQAFDYLAVKSIDQAVAALTADPERVRLMAGGTDLLPQLREGRRQVGVVMDVKQVPELSGISFDTRSGLRIGAAASCFDVCHDPD
ncbi:MAG TPA: FAD binding domain-containing protein, partial [Anaerolineales bacterium]|nr:FAD binding domain-containing protein [Anaerolineales bacterium]